MRQVAVSFISGVIFTSVIYFGIHESRFGRPNSERRVEDSKSKGSAVRGPCSISICDDNIYKERKNTCVIHKQEYRCGPPYANVSFRQALSLSAHKEAQDVWEAWLNFSSPFPSSPMRTMKAVVMTKDDWPLIKSWVLYHGSLLGFENLYVLDGSVDSDCVDFLTTVRDSLKVNVIFTPSDLNQIEADINEIMKSIASASDFVIKLDADEFLGRYMPKAYSKLRCPSNDTHNIFDCRLSPYGVQSLLNELILDGAMFRVGYDQHAVPEQSICEGGLADQFAASGARVMTFTRVNPSFFKTFFDSRTFDSVDLGSHFGRVLPPHDVFHV